MLTLSTVHITCATAELLDAEAIRNKMPGLVVYRKEDYGWFVYFPALEEEDRAHIPADLLDCIDLAVANHCEVLCLDGDGPICDLPEYDWDDDVPPSKPQKPVSGTISAEMPPLTDIQKIAYSRFQWTWLACRYISAVDLVFTLAMYAADFCDCVPYAEEELVKLFEQKYLNSKPLSQAKAKLEKYSVSDLIQNVAECANKLLGADDAIEVGTLETLFEQNGFQGSIYPCQREFIECEYRDSFFMQSILTKQEYSRYLEDRRR